MSTQAEQRVLDKLDLFQGNVQVVAEELGISESWVNRIKLSLWQPREAALTVANPHPDPEEYLTKLIPTNFDAVVALRDEAIKELRSLIRDKLISAKDLASVTRTILKYEQDVNSVKVPAVGVFQDNRQIHFNTLVEKMGEMGPDELRLLAGIPEPMVISAQKEEQ